MFGPNADSSSGLGGIEFFENQVSVDKFLENIGANFANETKVYINGIPATRVHYKGLPVSGEQVVLFDNGKIYDTLQAYACGF